MTIEGETTFEFGRGIEEKARVLKEELEQRSGPEFDLGMLDD